MKDYSETDSSTKLGIINELDSIAESNKTKVVPIVTTVIGVGNMFSGSMTAFAGTSADDGSSSGSHEWSKVNVPTLRMINL